MSKCYCGMVEIPLGAAMFNYGGEVHAVTACSRSADWKARAEKAEAAIRRVREVCDRRSSRVWINDQPGIQVVAVAQILDALDGDSDD